MWTKRPCAALRLPLLGLLAIGLAGAADDGERKKEVRVEVWAIRATMTNKDVDKDLRQIAKLLEKKFKYTGFKVEKKVGKKVELGTEFTADLIQKYRVTAKPLGVKDGKLEIELTLDELVKQNKDDPKKNEYKVHFRGKLKMEPGPLLPVGGLPLEGGDTLIVALRVR